MPNDLFNLPGPQSHSIAGNLTDFGQDPLAFLTRCANEFSDIIPMRLGLTPACLVTNPDYIEQVFKDRETFIKSRGFRVLKSLIGEGLLTAEGDSWLLQRRLSQPVFHQQRIHNYGATMAEYTDRTISSWQDGEIRDIHVEMMRLTLSIVMKTIFNAEVDNQDVQVVAHALNVTMDWFENKRRQGFLVWEWFPRPENLRYREAIAQMDEAIYRLIRQRRESQEHPADLLSMLMNARDEVTGEQMNDKLLRDEVATLMLAGHETTANALTWTWMLLSQYPNVREKLQAELQNVVANRLPTVDDIPNLPYTENIIKEAMRLYPPVPLIGREAKKDTILGDCEIHQGCVILVSQWVMHRSPKYFNNETAFQPERWEENLEKQLPKGVYIPFGDGPRVCIGKGFAMMEAILILATMAQRIQFDVLSEYAIAPQASITLRPEEGLKVKLKVLKSNKELVPPASI